MNLKLVMVISLSLYAAIPAVAYAQQNGPAAKAPKPTMADVQKLVQTISSDKAKVQAYCDMGKVLAQMDQAEQKKDTKAAKALGAKADSLAQQLGSDYTRSYERAREALYWAGADTALLGNRQHAFLGVQ